MAELRIGRGWSEAELEQRLERVRQADRNFSEPAEELSVEDWGRLASA